MKIKILKQTFVKGEFAGAGKVVEVSEKDSNDLIGGGHAIAVAESVKKPEHKEVAVKKKLFSRKKKQEILMMVQLQSWFKLAKANPKISIGVAVAVLIILFAIF